MTALRSLEADSIRSFVASCGDLFRGARVLDYGAGSCPYRDLICSFSPTVYVPYDRPDLPGSAAPQPIGDDSDLRREYDVIVTTQTIQYMREPDLELSFLRTRVPDDGALVITGPTNWPWIERDDRHRYTPTEAERLLRQARFGRVTVQERAHVEFAGERWLLGWQAVARP